MIRHPIPESSSNRGRRTSVTAVPAAANHQQKPAKPFQVDVVSGRADMVTGGDALPLEGTWLRF
jgi:hypothetical protein